MKIFKQIKNVFSRLPRKTVVSMVALGVLISVPVAMTLAEFYPDRPTFDYNKPCNPDDGDKYDRCGSLEGPVFNSFINTPSYGDERAFLDARRSDQTAAGSYENVLPDVTGGSKEVVIRMYVHNNANQSTNDDPSKGPGVFDGSGVAKNTKVRIDLPEGTSQALRARGYISADNAALVEDTVDFTAGEEFSVSYVPGSAIIYNNGALNGSALSDSVVTTGAAIGHDSLDGNLPGCFEYEAVVQIKVKVTPKANPNIKLTKEVRKKGETQWKKEVNAKPGEEVEWLLTTENTGQAVLNNNIIRDVLPPHVALKSGSVKWIDASQNAVQGDKPLFDGGINVGNYAPGSGFYMMFATTVNGDFTPCQVRVRNVAFVKSNETPEIQDDADVVITRDNCDEPEVPTYVCDSLTSSLVSGRTYRFTAKATGTNGATVKQYTYNFGDNTPELVTDKTVVDHAYANNGNFAATVKVTFNVNGGQQTVTGDKCVTPINIGVPPVTPPVLPNTGAGDIVAVFMVTTIVGAVAHRMYSLKRSY